MCRRRAVVETVEAKAGDRGRRLAAQHAVRHRVELNAAGEAYVTKRPEFAKALRVVAPTYKDSLGFQIGYIHNSPIVPPTDGTGSRDGVEIKIERYEGLRIEEALRLAYPFPIPLLAGIPESKHVVDAMFRKRSFGALTLRQETSHVPAHQEPALDSVDSQPSPASLPAPRGPWLQ